MECLPGWENYYNISHKVTFKTQQSLYLAALRDLADQSPATFTPDRPLHFVLGGFDATLSTPYEFVEFCQAFHPNPKDKHIFVDMNKAMIDLLDPKRYPYRVNSKLEDIGSQFSSNSVDVLFLDHTLLFMQDDQVRQFAAVVEPLLSRNGAILAAINNPISRRLYKILGKMKHTVPVYPRKGNEVFTCMERLKPVFWVNTKSRDLLALSRRDSDYRTHKGAAFACDEEELQFEVFNLFNDEKLSIEQLERQFV